MFTKAELAIIVKALQLQVMSLNRLGAKPTNPQEVRDSYSKAARECSELLVKASRLDVK